MCIRDRAIGGQLAAVICISDPLREEAKEVLSALRALGITSTVTVSYTHLDVYKRQKVVCASINRPISAAA